MPTRRGFILKATEKAQASLKNGARTKKNNTLVSGSAGDEKNLHSGGRKFIFFLINIIDFLK